MAESLHLLTSTHVSKPPEASTSVELTSANAHFESKQISDELGLPRRKSGSPKSCCVVGSG
ncbi:uncharacterized protein N7518_008930 [Penicillium psychrosexuale]|uniref:uncharacterized protein n=1 Tax=Penicillium psychrosexuale TaxID=1002107 RepID=UPI0025450BCB|nr:uncharacterized protein N7518_008930 [Penicillium psychrosexuale]KAJ5791919.1 hypothetical protein N7518_008930 [Penicillium psychrosexuale]